MKRHGMQADNRTRVHAYCTSKKGKIMRNERRRWMFNYQYFWNIFGIFYKCILGFMIFLTTGILM